MNRARYILRGTLLVVTLFLLANLIRTTDDHMGTIAKFKLRTLNKIKADSLNPKHKLEVLINETEKFSKQMDEDSPHIREAVQYLIGVTTLFILIEFGFYLSARRRNRI